MLCELAIKNFAIIDDLRIRFDEGLTVLSGETGAGKSIIINAVNLLLGSRASARLIRKGAEKAELEAHFQIPPKSATAKKIIENDFDTGAGLTIRRIISANDRHRVYINGRLSTMQQLTEFTENLASISGQHAHQRLLAADQHLLLLDQFAGHLRLRDEIIHLFNKMQPLLQKLERLRKRRRRQDEERELLQFQKTEIEAAEIQPDEDTALENERTRLKHAAQLYETVFNSIEALYDAPGSIYERLSDIGNSLGKAARIDPALDPVNAHINTLCFNMEAPLEQLRDYLQSLQIDDDRLDAVEERINVIQRLKRKYGGSLATVFEKRHEIEDALGAIETLTDQIEQSETELNALYQELSKNVQTISAKRHKAATRLAASVEKELAALKMPRSRFQVALSTQAAPKDASPYLTVEGCALDETGFDRAVFMIAPNVGEDLKPLAAIASGGELSRVVLALKAIIAQSDAVETVIFDEVDAGIGGSVAEVVGKKLGALAAYHQIICITHLPQIAKFARHHFQISKNERNGRTTTHITPLDGDQRVEELARMLGGENLTETTLAHARELLQEDQ